MTGVLPALGAVRGVIALAGAGGKTTLLYRLAHEAHAAGLRVLVTSTTRMGAPKEEHVFFDEDGDVALNLRVALAQSGRAMLLGRRERDDKTVGVAPERVDAVAGLAELVLVEADGARRRSFKIPAPHEPVVPRSTSLLLVVVGLDVLGQPLDDEHVHRLDRVAAAAGQVVGTAITEETLVRALLAPAGYCSRVPAGARTAVFFNKAEDAAARAAAARLGPRLRPAYDLVLAGSARDGVVHAV